MAELPRELHAGMRMVRAFASRSLGADAVATAVLEQTITDATHELAQTTGRLAVLRDRVALRYLDMVVLFTAMALEHDPLATLTFVGLLGEPPATGVTARLVAMIAQLGGVDSVALELGPDHPLVVSGVLEDGGPEHLPATIRGYRLAARATAWLCGDDSLSPVLMRVGGALLPVAGLADEVPAAPCALIERLVSTGEQVVLVIEGADGSGRRSLIATALAGAAATGVVIDAGLLAADRGRAIRELRALRRECWLRDAVPVIARLDAWTLPEAERGEVLVDGLGGLRGCAIVSGTAGVTLPELGRRALRIQLEAAPPALRIRTWNRALPDTTCAPDIAAEVVAIATRYALGPGAIRRVVGNTTVLGSGPALTVEVLRAGLATELQSQFAGLATRVTVTQQWTDLVLPTDTSDEIRAFIARTRHTARVYDDWGFRDKLGRGMGLAALFSGPPGTGKTMVAGLIARELGLDLYMVDLSQIVSKWVGETEKHLGRVFDCAAAGNALLLFDEADALFAQRTEVKSSNDRYANLEVNFLLSKLEQFSGVAILTTNLEGSIDPAFRRRLAAHVRFYSPEERERELLWRRMIPDGAPLDAAIDFAALAKRYEDLAGGHIRNSVLRAAFLAAGDDVPISYALLDRAAAAEYREMGKLTAARKPRDRL